MLADEQTRQSGVYLANMSRPPSAGEDTVMSSSVGAPVEPYEVVVQFTAQYHPDAHRLLADTGLTERSTFAVPQCSPIPCLLLLLR